MRHVLRINRHRNENFHLTFIYKAAYLDITRRNMGEIDFGSSRQPAAISVKGTLHHPSSSKVSGATAISETYTVNTIYRHKKRKEDERNSKCSSASLLNRLKPQTDRSTNRWRRRAGRKCKLNACNSSFSLLVALRCRHSLCSVVVRSWKQIESLASE